MYEEHEGKKANEEVRQVKDVDGMEDTLRVARFRWYSHVGEETNTTATWEYQQTDGRML